MKQLACLNGPASRPHRGHDDGGEWVSGVGDLRLAESGVA